jgi:hypothetical protein
MTDQHADDLARPSDDSRCAEDNEVDSMLQWITKRLFPVAPRGGENAMSKNVNIRFTQNAQCSIMLMLNLLYKRCVLWVNVCHSNLGPPAVNVSANLPCWLGLYIGGSGGIG